MEDIERVHAAAESILNENKQEISPQELSIIIKSQYYNIETMFSYISNYKDNDINNHILIVERIIKLCKAFDTNIELFPSILSWENREHQENRVKGIKNEMKKVNIPIYKAYGIKEVFPLSPQKKPITFVIGFFILYSC